MEKMTDDFELKIGDLIIPKPGRSDATLAGCILIVEEVVSFGCYAFIQKEGSQNQPGERTPLMANWGEFDIVGHSKWHANAIASWPKAERNLGCL